WGIHPGYITDVENEFVMQFLDQASKQNKPFLLIYAARAPHAPAIPSPEDRILLQDLPPYRPPSFDEADVSNMPSSISSIPLMSPTEIAHNDAFRRDQLLTLISLDHNVGNIVAKLQEIAPTIYDLAGIPIPTNVDGMSFVKLIKGEPWRDNILIESWPERGYWAGIRTYRCVYVETENDLSELYDLQTDPFELNNLIHDAQDQAIIADLKAKLQTEKQPRSP
ncbi:MAG: sulfatase/phosphatase domain-containing protein, partial [Anaerolineales bacterium]